jgi:hypothetical protein
MKRIRGEMDAPRHARPAYRRIQVAAVAISFLAAVSIGITWLIRNGGSPTTEVKYTEAGEGVASQTVSPEKFATAWSLVDTASLIQPSLVVSQREYTPSELASFRNDLGAKLDFYSSYWYPAVAAGASDAEMTQVQAKLTEGLSQQAAAIGRSPDELKKAIQASLAVAGNEKLLPCYAELATMQGKEVWLISLSGPEDYLLFPDPKMPPAMHLASRGGQVSLKISESLLRELAGLLAPNYDVPSNITACEEKGTKVSEGGTLQQEVTNAVPPSSEAAGGSAEETVPLEQRHDFQAFLRQIAVQGNNFDAISALKKLNYQQLLLLLQGNWSALASEGVDLTDFLIPPKRLWAVDCSSGEVIWGQ